MVYVSMDLLTFYSFSQNDIVSYAKEKVRLRPFVGNGSADMLHSTRLLEKATTLFPCTISKAKPFNHPSIVLVSY